MVVSFLQPPNILVISGAESVLKLEMSIVITDEHSLNMPDIIDVFEVSKFVQSIAVTVELPSKSDAKLDGAVITLSVLAGAPVLETGAT